MFCSGYKWIGLSAQGQKISGTQQAKNIRSLKTYLSQKKITLLSHKRIIGFTRQRIHQQKIIAFTQELNTLMRAHILLPHAFSLMQNEDVMDPMQKMIRHISEKINEGKHLSEALSDSPKYFNALYIAMIHAGEISGALPSTLSKLLRYLEKQQSIRNKIKKALFYPIIVLGISLLITMGLIIFIMPQFQDIYRDFNADLPWLTQGVLALSDFIRAHCLGITTTLISLIWGLRYGIQHQKNIRKKIDALYFKIPFLKNILTAITLSRWSALLATTTQAGISLLEALAVANKSTSNTFIKTEYDALLHDIESGMGFSKALASRALFPERAKRLIATGEASGHLASVLDQMAQMYEDHCDNRLDYLSKLLEPVIMLGLAVTTGILILAIYLPVFKMGAII